MYDLHKLGWKSFQDLCLTIAREILGQTVESFLESKDGGRDGAFTGTWGAMGQEDLSGSYVVQCKFTGKADGRLRTSDLSDEAEKARRLVAQGHCDSYMLMTNAGVSGVQNTNIQGLFKAVGVKHFKILDSTWINQQIRENQHLRMMVPRVYGLGDLSQILDERAYDQSQSILASMRDDIAKVVITDSYRRAVDALNKHGFVLLIGEPASGKSTIASLMAMAALDTWNASVLKLDFPNEVTKHWNPNEPSQFFWLDDAFGVTQYEAELVREWNRVLQKIQTMVRGGAKVVIASRDYIYNRARQELKVGAFPLLHESQVVVDVRALSVDEKQQILYNHIKLGNQSQPFRTEIKPHLDRIARHPRFIPEIARRLGDPIFTKKLYVEEYDFNPDVEKHMGNPHLSGISRIDWGHIDEFIESREELLQEIIQSLDPDSRAALALVYMRNGRLESPVDVQPMETRALELLGSSLGGCVNALHYLDGSLVSFIDTPNESTWQFRHPTIGDAYAAILTRSPEHMGIFIEGSTMARLQKHVTCGDVGVTNAVVIPKSLFPQMLEKLGSMNQSDSKVHESTPESGEMMSHLWFLAHRCNKEFMSMYLKKVPGLLDLVAKPGMLLDIVAEVDLAARLHEYGLLPDKQRKEFIETVSNYAEYGQDAAALNNQKIRNLFTDREFEHLVQRVRVDLLPNLDSVRDYWESTYDGKEMPEDYLYPLFDFYEALEDQFYDDEEAIQIIERERSRTYDWINDTMLPEREDIDEDPWKMYALAGQKDFLNTRSIYDDVDAG